MGYPVIWCSKLQPYIATSTIKSEYTAVFMSLQAAIPLMAITEAINNGFQSPTSNL